MSALSPGSHGHHCDPAADSQPADGGHEHLMTTARECKSELPTSLDQPSQKARVAARVKTLVHRHTDTLCRTRTARCSRHPGGPIPAFSVPLPPFYLPLSSREVRDDNQNT